MYDKVFSQVASLEGRACARAVVCPFRVSWVRFDGCASLVLGEGTPGVGMMKNSDGLARARERRRGRE